MYVSALGNLDTALLPRTAAMEKIITFLKTFDFSRLIGGKDYPIDGKRIFARIQRYETLPRAECRPEKHEIYMDIVYMVEGVEEIGWCNFCPNLEAVTEYDEKNDVTFYDSLVPESSIVVGKDALAIISTLDVHRPCTRHGGEPSKVVKIIIKAEEELLLENWGN